MINHPLMPYTPAHYLNEDKELTIKEIEAKLTFNELIGFVKGNILKYSLREDKKGQKESDKIKAESYIKYSLFLEDIKKRAEKEVLSCVLDKVKLPTLLNILEIEVNYKKG